MERIREIRKQKGMTMKQLGLRIGVTEAAISNYEIGKREPDITTLQCIADVLETSVDYLLGRTDKPFSNNTEDQSSIQSANRHQLEGTDVVTRLRHLSPERLKQAMDYIAFLEQQDD